MGREEKNSAEGGLSGTRSKVCWICGRGFGRQRKWPLFTPAIIRSLRAARRVPIASFRWVLSLFGVRRRYWSKRLGRKPHWWEKAARNAEAGSERSLRYSAAETVFARPDRRYIRLTFFLRFCSKTSEEHTILFVFQCWFQCVIWWLVKNCWLGPGAGSGKGTAWARGPELREWAQPKKFP